MYYGNITGVESHAASLRITWNIQPLHQHANCWGGG